MRADMPISDAWGKIIRQEKDNVPETFRDLKNAFGEDWGACFCVAGTASEDMRRAVVTYARDLNKAAANFPSDQTDFHLARSRLWSG